MLWTENKSEKLPSKSIVCPSNCSAIEKPSKLTEIVAVPLAISPTDVRTPFESIETKSEPATTDQDKRSSPYNE